MLISYGITVLNRNVTRLKNPTWSWTHSNWLNEIVEINKLYKELGWLKLSERKDLHKLFFFFKMDHGLVPLYLSNILPPHVEDVFSYRLWNAGNYVGSHANTCTYADSFLPSTKQARKNLPDSVRSAHTLGSFKHLLTLDTLKLLKYYFCGDRFNKQKNSK